MVGSWCELQITSMSGFLTKRALCSCHHPAPDLLPGYLLSNPTSLPCVSPVQNMEILILLIRSQYFYLIPQQPWERGLSIVHGSGHRRSLRSASCFAPLSRSAGDLLKTSIFLFLGTCFPEEGFGVGAWAEPYENKEDDF